MQQGIKMKNPPHIGGFIKYEILEPRNLNVSEASKILGVSRPALSGLLNERVSLSPEMAIRLEKAFGVSMDTLLRMQNAWDIAQARKREHEIHVAPYVYVAI